MSDQTTIYNRQVYTILDLLGQIGGFTSVVFGVGSVLVASYAKADLDLSLVS